MPGPRIAIVGCGAIGLYYGGRLAHGGNDVHFLLRSDFEHVRSRGIRATSIHGDFSLAEVQAHHSSAAIGPCDYVLVALKAIANDALPALLAPLLKDATLVVTLQNGLGNEEFLADHLGPERVAGGLCFVCINRIAPGLVDHSASGLISMGEFGRPAGERLRVLKAMMRGSGIECQTTDDLACERWRKLVWNVPFNGLSIAAGGIDVRAILADSGTEALVRALMAEIIAGAASLGHHLPDSIIDQQIEVTRPMRAYKPSSLIDYLAGKPVEVEAIWGEPYRRATAAGASVPRLEMLYQLLRALTSAS
jgi:2-dehydropantoate 2-reductase